MSDLKLFRLNAGKAMEIEGNSFALEKSLQRIIEDNLEPIFGVRLLASEYSTGKAHGGRMDSIGIDENNSPVILEYKRSTNENVINQGLFYLDWLLDHRGDFRELVRSKLADLDPDLIDWSGPRLVCVAGDFTRYDEYAIKQIDRNIELVRYRDFGGDLIAFERIAATTGKPNVSLYSPSPTPNPSPSTQAQNVLDYLDRSPQDLKDLYADLEARCEALGDDITRKTLKWYIAFRRLKNFAEVEIHPQKRELLVFVKLDPSTLTHEPGFSRDVSAIGHYGTGNLELRITSRTDLDRAMPFIQQAYEFN